MKTTTLRYEVFTPDGFLMAYATKAQATARAKQTPGAYVLDRKTGEEFDA